MCRFFIRVKEEGGNPVAWHKWDKRRLAGELANKNRARSSAQDNSWISVSDCKLIFFMAASDLVKTKASLAATNRARKNNLTVAPHNLTSKPFQPTVERIPNHFKFSATYQVV